jgi:hypothetical protein
MNLVDRRFLQIARQSEEIRMKWYRCKVTRVGPALEAQNVLIFVQLMDKQTSPAWPGARWFKMPSALQREMLAVALSALGAACDVDVVLPEPPNEYSECNRLYMIAP